LASGGTIREDVIGWTRERLKLQRRRWWWRRGWDGKHKAQDNIDEVGRVARW
jgi:hypothetical protein